MGSSAVAPAIEIEPASYWGCSAKTSVVKLYRSSKLAIADGDNILFIDLNLNESK